MNPFFKNLFPKATQTINVRKFYPRIDVSRIDESKILMNFLKCTVGSFFLFVTICEIGSFGRERSLEKKAIAYAKLLKAEEENGEIDDIDDYIYDKYRHRSNDPFPDEED